MLNASKRYGNRGGDAYSWAMTSGDNTLASIWAGYYRDLANLNLFLERIEEFTPPATRASFADTVAVVKGHAHFLRAYCYWELALRWSRLYNPDMPCVPLYTRFDPQAKQPRATQGEVFSFIIQELSLAERMLAGVPSRPSSDAITPDAVAALKARVLLEMGRHQEAYDAAKGLIGNAAYHLLSDANSLRAMWHEDRESPEVLMMPWAKLPDEPGCVIDIYIGYVAVPPSLHCESPRPRCSFLSLAL